ncbi:hypothetical protein BG005_008797 [Podila minutissima]|nr:hypothetical protein BG005_008797 [Podila minutissima]
MSPYQELGVLDPLAPSDFWAIKSLPLANQSRIDLMRANLRPDPDTISSNITLDEAIASTKASIPTSGATTGTNLSNQKTSIPSELAQESALDSVVDQGPASSQISQLMKRIITPGEALPRQDFEMELYRIGSLLLSHQGLSPEFLRVPANQQDIIATGLDSLLAAAYRNPDPNVRSVEQMVDLLTGYDLLRVIERGNLHRLQSALAAPIPDTLRPWTPTTEKQESLDRALKEAVINRGLKQYDREEWKIQTRRFRLALALARETGKSPTEEEYTRFMRICRKSGLYQEQELALHHFLDHEGSPSEKMFREYIKGLVHQNRMEHAQEVFNNMKRRGIAPSLVSYGVLMEGYGRRLDFKKMKNVVRSLESAGLAPNLVMYTSMMGSYIRAGELDLARQVYDQLQQRNDMELDYQAQNVIANLMRLQRRQGEQAFYKPGTPISPPSALAGDVGDYTEAEFNSVIAINHELIKVAESMDTIRFARKFKKLRDRGLRPNTTTLNILLHVLNQTGKLEDGLRVLDYMKSTKEAQPDTVTFSTLLHGAVDQGKVELGWSLYDEMMSKSLLPTLETYSSLIELVGLDPRSKFGRATVRRYFIPSEKPQVRYSVKASVEEQVGLNFATQLYNQLCNQGLRPNEHIFGALLNLTIRGGYMGLAQPVYLEMTRQNVQPNTAIMTTLIKGFEIQKDFESGWRVWRNMVETGIPRNVITYHHLLRLCERSLPNPMMLAELLESDGNVSESSCAGEKKKRGRRRKGSKEDTKASELLENTARIPLKIWTEVRNQMVVDQVHWDRVQQFRRKEVDRRIWRPIPKEAGPVRDASEVGDDARDVSMAASFDEYLDLFEKKAPSNEARQDESHGRSGDETTTTMIQEIYTGGGDQFVPKRGAIEPFRLQWDKETLSPILKKDETKRDKAMKGMTEESKCDSPASPEAKASSDSPASPVAKESKGRMSQKKRRRLAELRQQEQLQQSQPRPVEVHHVASGSI